MSKEQLLRLLAQNEIDQVFQSLRQSALSEIVLLEGQWHDLKADNRAGVLTQEQANVEESRIRRRLLELIESGDQPAGMAGRPTPANNPRAILIGIGVLIILLFGLLLLKPWLSDEGAEKTGETTEKPAGAGATTEPEKLEIPPAPIQLTAAYTGTTGYQILEAVLSDKNPAHYTLTVRMRCIRPPYGQGISAATLHLKHGEEEKAPYEVEFPFVQPNTTGEGVLKFEAPKAWRDAVLVIYHGAVPPLTTAEIPLRF